MSQIENSKVELLKSIFKSMAPEQKSCFMVNQDVEVILREAHIDVTGLEVCIWFPAKNSIRLCKFVKEL